VGIIKTAIREAILEGEIPNDFKAAYEFMLKKGSEIGLNPKHKLKASIQDNKE
jgi:hypothetical protein